MWLADWPDGRRWLSWWQANKDWAGQPLWADRRWRENATCAAFERAIVCLNLLDPNVRGTQWELVPVLLGTLAMRKVEMEPHTDSQPAEIVLAYLTHLQAQGYDPWYVLGAVQSPPTPIGGQKMAQYFQRARLQWTAGERDPDPKRVELAPLGKLAVEQGW